MVNIQTIGKNIRKNREKMGITQLELSQKLLVSFQAVSAWERGLTLPDLVNAAKLANFFNIKLDTLLQDTESHFFVGIDGGAEKTEFVLFEKDGYIRKRLVLEGISLNNNGMEKSIEVLNRGLEEIFDGTSALSIFAGISGVTMGNGISVLKNALVERYDVSVNVDTDAINVLAMANEPDNAAAVICGAESCVYLRNNYRLTRIGGWGHIFDGAGSAYDIGREAVSHTLAVYDGLENKSVLSELVEKYVDGDIWASLSSIYQNGRKYIASFAQLVVEADALGDGVARNILEKNAHRLAVLIKSAVTKHGAPAEFVGSGDFFKNSVFKNMVEGESGVIIYSPKMPSVYGACLEAMHLNGEEINDNFKSNFMENYR